MEGKFVAAVVLIIGEEVLKKSTSSKLVVGRLLAILISFCETITRLLPVALNCCYRQIPQAQVFAALPGKVSCANQWISRFK